MSYVFHVMVMIGIYSLVSYGTNLVTGYGGLLTFCQAVFYGVGAYVLAILTVGTKGSVAAQDLFFSASLPFPVSLVLAAIAAAAVAFTFGAIALRLRGDFFVFGTIGFQMIFFTIVYNWSPLARGALGIYGISQPDIFGWKVADPSAFAILIVILNSIILPMLFVLYRSPFGLSLRALREDERAAESLGIAAFRQHLWAVTLSGLCAGVAGAVFASYITYIDPTSFTLKESIFMAAILLLGGSGNILGPILGAITMVTLPELLRFVHIPSAAAGNLREMIYGIALIALMYWRPRGMAGSHALK